MKSIKVILNDNDELYIENEGDLTFGHSLGMLLDGMEGLLKHAVDQLEDTRELHDYMTYALTSILERTFPEEVAPDLTEAAIYKAQNEIIEESMDTGVPLDDVIARYNEEAAKYVKAAKGEN